MSHRCPAPGCAKRVRDDVLFCRDHWWSLPHRIRVRLSRARDGNTSQLAGVDAAAVARADAVRWLAAHPARDEDATR